MRLLKRLHFSDDLHIAFPAERGGSSVWVSQTTLENMAGAMFYTSNSYFFLCNSCGKTPHLPSTEQS